VDGELDGGWARRARAGTWPRGLTSTRAPRRMRTLARGRSPRPSDRSEQSRTPTSERARVYGSGRDTAPALRPMRVGRRRGREARARVAHAPHGARTRRAASRRRRRTRAASPWAGRSGGRSRSRSKRSPRRSLADTARSGPRPSREARWRARRRSSHPRRPRPDRRPATARAAPCTGRGGPRAERSRSGTVARRLVRGPGRAAMRGARASRGRPAEINDRARRPDAP